MGIKVYIVNAFTKNNQGGNGAGVVICDEPLNKLEMSIIAKEIGLSETAFALENKKKKGKNKEDFDYEVRFFTPTQEVDLCGHATIATFYTLGKLGFIKIDDENGRKNLKQKTKAGILDVEVNFKDGKVKNVLMTQGNPKFDFIIEDSSELCDILDIKNDDVMDKIKPQAVSTGLLDIMFPVKDLETLKNINPDFQRLKSISEKLRVIGLHAFTFETEKKESTVSTRNFGPAAGIDEESATGTSNGALTAYLIKNNLLNLDENDEVVVSCEQGYYMGNPSEIIVKGCKKNDSITIKVGGCAFIKEIRYVDLGKLKSL